MRQKLQNRQHASLLRRPQLISFPPLLCRLLGGWRALPSYICCQTFPSALLVITLLDIFSELPHLLQKKITMLSFPSVLQSTKCSPVFCATQIVIHIIVLVNFQIWPIKLRWTPVMDNPVCFYCLVHLFNQYQQSPCSPSSTNHDIHNNKDQL